MQNNSDFHFFFLISDTQLSLLKVLHNFETFCMQEKIRSYLSNAVQSHDPYISYGMVHRGYPNRPTISLLS